MLRFAIPPVGSAILLICILGLQVHASGTGPTGAANPMDDLVVNQTDQSRQVSSKMNEQSETINKAVRLATSDLAKRLGHSDFTVTQANAVTWSDASAGCAAPGYSYPQVLTPGYLIVFTRGDETYRYTGSLRSNPKWCPAAQFRPPSEANSDA